MTDFQKDTLERLSYVDKYNKWIVSKFESFLKGSILELGAGLGNITFEILARGHKILPTDIDRHFLNSLRKINPKACYLNIQDVNPKTYGRFETIIVINVIEHIKDDNIAFRNIYKLLKKGGVLVVLVPAHKNLFGSYDRLAKHCRRYTKSELESKLKREGFKTLSISYHNKLGAVGWFFNAVVFKKKEFPKSQLFIINFVVPLLDFIDNLIPFDFGLSIVCVVKKP